MPVFLDNPYNPNPISKLMVTFLLGFAVFHKVNIYFEWAIIPVSYTHLDVYKRQTYNTFTL